MNTTFDELRSVIQTVGKAMREKGLESSEDLRAWNNLTAQVTRLVCADTPSPDLAKQLAETLAEVHTELEPIFSAPGDTHLATLERSIHLTLHALQSQPDDLPSNYPSPSR